MFTLQASQFAAQLNDAGMNPRVSEIMLAMLGNCSQQLEHRGQTTINVSMPDAEYTIGDTGIPAEGYPAAALTTITGGRQVGDKIIGGFAEAFHGPVWFGGPVVFNQAVNGAVRFAKATANWSKGGGRPYVTCQECSDDTGSDAAGAAFNVYLPRTKPGDPNVIANAVLPFGLTRNGTRVCTGDYLDDKIGIVKAWALAAGNIPAGWGLLDGTGNASGNGGSGLNPGTRLFKYHATPGTTGGSNSYTPAGSVSISSVTGTVSVTVNDKSYTGTETVSVELDLSTLESDSIVINDHPNHHHHIARLATDYPAGEDFTAYTLDGGAATHGTDGGGNPLLATSDGFTEDSDDTDLHRSHNSPTATFTGATAYSTNATFSLSGWDHGHTATGSFSFSSGSGSFSGTPATIEPEWFGLIWIERLDNSA
jgi:hypothetical protein